MHQQKYALSPLSKAYLEVHSPTSEKALSNASDRIALDEYFKLISAFKIIKGDKKQLKPRKYTVNQQDFTSFISRFPYEFTDGQKQAVNEIIKDLKSPFTMNRLLQGDVGSGKTAVSLCALFTALKSGYQCALLSPTEVLAKQNYKVAKTYLSEFEIGYLSGSLTEKEKKSVKEKLKAGEIKLLVGTHAVIQ